MDKDRFGNPHAPALPYARGRILASTEDDFRKLRRAWSLIREHGPESVFVFTGLEHGLAMTAEEVQWADDELAPAIYLDRLTALALQHLGGSEEFHDVAVFNRLTGATLATHLTLVRPGDVVAGVSASHSHPTVIRSAAMAGARFIDTVGVDDFARALEREPRVALVVLTRLAVTYELMPVEGIRTVVKLAHDKSALVYVDDAGGARVAPAAFDHPRMLELYRPERVRELIASTRRVADALRPIFGARLHETPTTAQLLADDLLTIAMERGGVKEPPIVPYEAAAAFCMILLEDQRVLTVHFVGMPPGTANILFKFVRPETLESFGGPDKFAQVVDLAVTRLGLLLREPERIKALLFGDA